MRNKGNFTQESTEEQDPLTKRETGLAGPLLTKREIGSPALKIWFGPTHSLYSPTKSCRLPQLRPRVRSDKAGACTCSDRHGTISCLNMWMCTLLLIDLCLIMYIYIWKTLVHGSWLRSLMRSTMSARCHQQTEKNE